MERIPAIFIFLTQPLQRAIHPQVATGDNPWITDKNIISSPQRGAALSAVSPLPGLKQLFRIFSFHGLARPRRRSAGTHGYSCLLPLLVLFSLSACMDLGEPKCDAEGKCPGSLVCDTNTNKCVTIDAGLDGAIGDTGVTDTGTDAAVDASSDSSFGDAQDGSYPSDASQDAGLDGGTGDTGISDAGSDGGTDAGLAPVITGIDGDGTEKPVVCPDAGPCTGAKAQHRFRTAWIVSGLRLDTVTNTELKGSKTYGPDAGLMFEDGGTAMQRKLLLPITLVAGMFTLTISNDAGYATAETYILQGEQGIQGQQGVKGDPGDSIFTCDAGVCATSQQVKVNNTFTSNSVSTGSVTATGTISGSTVSGTTVTAGTTLNPPSSFTASNLTVSGTLTAANLNITGTYLLPDCPEGYSLASSPAGVTLCKKGSDEMVKVGSFWIDKYEGIIVNSDYYSNGKCDLSGGGNPQVYGQSGAPDWDGLGFPRTGNWSAALYSCSKTGVKPSAYMTWFQAQEACALSGKELCTNEQWQAATAGTYDTTGTETGTQCHIAIANSSARNTGSAGSTPAGTDSCMSKWGTEDMIGNLYEWVAMWGQAGGQKGGGGTTVDIYDFGFHGTTSSGQGFASFAPETTGDADGTWNLAGGAYGCDKSGDNCGVFRTGLPFATRRGGYWAHGPQAGVFALNLDSGPSTSYESLGFRCCRGR